MESHRIKKVVFLTGTRADFGKIKSLIKALLNSQFFEVHIFATGMHMNSKYGYTVDEIEKNNFPNIYKYINHCGHGALDSVMANTVSGFGNYVREINPDMIVVHGDRTEALAGALVGSLNNILVAHIEGGEISGTIDESIRHAVSKVSHIHFAANNLAKKRLIQLGENRHSIFVIGSPDIDIMNSKMLPPLEAAKKKYNIPFDRFAILAFHPVSTELHDLPQQTNVLVDSVLESGIPYIAIYPNNDPGGDVIFNAYNSRLKPSKQIRLFPSIGFEYFLTFLKNALFIIGNSSIGVREAPYYGVPSINMGNRQHNRIALNKANKSIRNCSYAKGEILKLIKKISNKTIRYKTNKYFGVGNSDKIFLKILRDNKFWKTNLQKQFSDIDF